MNRWRVGRISATLGSLAKLLDLLLADDKPRDLCLIAGGVIVAAELRGPKLRGQA